MSSTVEIARDRTIAILRINKQNSKTSKFYFSSSHAEKIGEHVWFSDHGYAKRCIMVDGKKKHVTLARIICEIEDGEEIPHNMRVSYNDRDKRNNFRENLSIFIDTRK